MFLQELMSVAFFTQLKYVILHLRVAIISSQWNGIVVLNTGTIVLNLKTFESIYSLVFWLVLLSQVSSYIISTSLFSSIYSLTLSFSSILYIVVVLTKLHLLPTTGDFKVLSEFSQFQLFRDYFCWFIKIQDRKVDITRSHQGSSRFQRQRSLSALKTIWFSRGHRLKGCTIE